LSLKVVHLFFIVCSIALSAYFGGWCITSYDFESNPLFVGLGFLSLAASGGLVFYLFYFLKKTKGYDLLMWLVAIHGVAMSNEAKACSVCQFAAPDSPLVTAIREGIWVLLFLLVPVLVGFLSLFIFWARRDSALAKPRLQSPTGDRLE